MKEMSCLAAVSVSSLMRELWTVIAVNVCCDIMKTFKCNEKKKKEIDSGVACNFVDKVAQIIDK